MLREVIETTNDHAEAFLLTAALELLLA